MKTKRYGIPFATALLLFATGAFSHFTLPSSKPVLDLYLSMTPYGLMHHGFGEESQITNFFHMATHRTGFSTHWLGLVSYLALMTLSLIVLYRTKESK